MDEQIFSPSDLENELLPSIKQSFNELESQYKSSQHINCQELLAILKLFIDTLERIKVIEQGKLKYNSDDLIIEGTDSAFLQFMIFGAELVYKIRSMLLQEDIDYYLGGYTDDGALAEKKVEQSEILKNLTANLKEGEILLKSEMEKFEDSNKIAAHLNNLWIQVQTLADYSNVSSKTSPPPEEIPATRNTQNGNKETYFKLYYQKTSYDTNVYIRYRGGQENTEKDGYYKLQSGKYSFFNQGWLYEWFREYVSQQGGYTRLKNSLEQNSLSVMMKKIDNAPGYTGGDFVVGKKQIQAKFGNLKIISFNSIAKVLITLKENLEIYNSVEKSCKEESVNKIVRLFTQSNTEKINRSYTRRVDSVLNETIGKFAK